MMPHTVIEWLLKHESDVVVEAVERPHKHGMADVVSGIRKESSNPKGAFLAIGIFGDGVPHQRLCVTQTNAICGA